MFGTSLEHAWKNLEHAWNKLEEAWNKLVNKFIKLSLSWSSLLSLTLGLLGA